MEQWSEEERAAWKAEHPECFKFDPQVLARILDGPENPLTDEDRRLAAQGLQELAPMVDRLPYVAYNPKDYLNGVPPGPLDVWAEAQRRLLEEGQSVGLGYFAVEEKPSRRKRFWRWLGFREPGFPDMSEYDEDSRFCQASISVYTAIRLDWKDRLRCLITPALELKISVKTDVPVVDSAAKSEFGVRPPGWII